MTSNRQTRNNRGCLWNTAGSLVGVRIGAVCVTLAVLIVADRFGQAQERRGPFTHAPRSVRSRDADQRHIRLEMKLDLDKQSLDGRAELTLEPFRKLTTLKLDAAEMKVERVERLGDEGSTPVELKHRHRGGSLEIDLDRPAEFGETLKLAVKYAIAKPQHGAHFVVPDKDEPSQPRMVWTQSEPEFARFWYPCFDSPSDRITSETIVTVGAAYFVLSNGVLKERRDNGDGTQTWHWVQADSHVPYLMSVVAGDFEAYEQRWGDVPIVSYVPRGRLADAARSFEKTPAMMAHFSEKIGVAYPWPKYAQICVDEYQWGGMEHTSATTLNLSTLHDERAHLDVSSDNLVAHELAHQWFGDLVTCKDWGELWLNESFATYFATLWTEHDLGWDEAAWQGQQETESYLNEAKRYTRPIVSYEYNAPVNMFDRHSYPKGGRVLHMLRFVLGDELFWRGIRRYVEINRHRTVETADFRTAMEETTGEGLTWFFDQWLHHAGHPSFEIAWRWDDDSQQASVAIRQTHNINADVPLFRTPAELEFAWETETQIERIKLSKAEETFHFKLPRRPTRVVFDPNNWILKELKHEASNEEWLDQLANDRHVMARVRAIDGLKPLAKDDEATAALIAAMKSDSFWGVRQRAAESLADRSGDAVRAALIDVAKSDAKSDVRRAAIKALDRFAHDDTRAALRRCIAEDRSYYAVADALRSLTKVDAENVEADLLAQLDAPSHREMILQAACDGLAANRSAAAAERLAAQLDQPLDPERRVRILGALARMKPDDAEATSRLFDQLDNGRREVRQAAIGALVEIGDPASIAELQKRRDREESLYLARDLDEAIEKIRAKQSSFEQLRKEADALRKKNQELEERLRKIEAAIQNSK